MLATGVALAMAGTATAAPYLYAVNSDGSVSQFDATDGGLVALSPTSVTGGSGIGPGYLPQLVVSPDARSLYVPVPADDAIRQFDIGADGRLTAKPAAGAAAGDRPVAVAVSPDGGSAYAANADANTVSQFDVGPGGALTPKANPTVGAGSQPDAIVASPDGGSVYVAHHGDDTISRYAVGPDGALSSSPVSTVATGNQPRSLALAPDGRSLYAVAATRLWQYDVAPSGELAPKTPADVIGAVAAGGGLGVSPDGRDLYVADSSTPDVGWLSLDADGGATRQALVPAPTTTATIAVAPDGRSVYAGSELSASLFQWDRSPSGALTAKTPAAVPAGGVSAFAPPAAIALSPASDLALAATGAPSTVAPNGLLTYTLTATNTGNPATQVVIAHDLPADVTVESATSTQGTCTTTSGVRCALGTLANGASATVTVTVRPHTPGTVTATAHVSALQPDPDGSNDDATVTTAVTSAPLATTGAASELTPTEATLNGVVAPAGRPTTYRFEWGAGGSLDRQAPATAASAGDGTDGVAVSAPVGGLQPSTTYAYRLVATNADGATATGATRTFTTPARPVPVVDLALTGSAAPARVTAGDRLTFEFAVSSRSATDAATGVRLVDPLPGGTTFDADGSSPGCALAADGGTVTCAVGTLSPGAAATVRVAVRADQAGALANTALVTADQPDAHAGDDSVTVRATVVAVAAKPEPTPTTVTLRGKPAQKGTAVQARLRCRAAPGARCRGTVTLTARVSRGRRRARTVTLGRASYAIAAGRTATVTTRLSRSARSLLAREDRLTATLTARLGTGARAKVAATAKRIPIRR